VLAEKFAWYEPSTQIHRVAQPLLKTLQTTTRISQMTAELPPLRKPLDKLYERLARLAKQHSCAVEQRQRELDREWSSERMVRATALVHMGIGVIQTALVSPWSLLLVVVAGFVLLRSVMGGGTRLAEPFTFCGFRTEAQIEEERTNLQDQRGENSEGRYTSITDLMSA
jgi:Flp pilus assembly protein TadB